MRPIVMMLVLACGGCSVAPAPAWKADARDALDSFATAYLAGDSRTAERYFNDARRAVAGTGRADLVARVELYRCAIGTAALDFDACAGAAAMQGDFAEEDRPYAGFLEGKTDPALVGKLPERYQPVVKARDADARSRVLRTMDDPRSRLVAAGALFRAGELTPEGVEVAVNAASEQGWRRPLLSWLNVQLKLAEGRGDAAASETIRRRIDLAGGTGQ